MSVIRFLDIFTKYPEQRYEEAQTEWRRANAQVMRHLHEAARLGAIQPQSVLQTMVSTLSASMSFGSSSHSDDIWHDEVNHHIQQSILEQERAMAASQTSLQAFGDMMEQKRLARELGFALEAIRAYVHQSRHSDSK